jgi:plasmid stabilization system protein ParE
VSDEVRRATIRISGDFDARIMDIERYWNRVDRPESFERLAQAIETKVTPLLERFPAIGRRLPDLADPPLVGEERGEAPHVVDASGGQLHEYLFGDYCLLYRLRGNTVTFLSIRHMKELAFNPEDARDPVP